MLELHDAASPDFPVSSFAQMGYLAGKAATEALLRMGEGAEYTAETVNEAFRTLTNVESDMWCKPWYFSSGLDEGNVSLPVASSMALMATGVGKGGQLSSIFSSSWAYS